MATAFKYEVFRAPLTSANDVGTAFTITDSSAVIDYIICQGGQWIVIYHTA